MAEFPCAMCAQNCENDVIQCTNCKNWVHRICVPLSASKFQSWSCDNLDFLCRNCCFSNGQFDAAAALSRLSMAEATGRKDILTYCANSQIKLLETYDVRLTTSQSDLGTVCNVSLDILKLYQPAILDRFVPLYVVGDGNCLYRAVSRALNGDENQHALLRLKTALEILSNRKFYDTSMRTYNDQINDNRIIVSDYNKLIRDSIQLGSYSEMIHIYALSAVLQMPIRSYYPPQMSPELSSDCYTRKVVGRKVRSKTDPSVTIMWTQMLVPRTVRSFVPNHFVCLSEKVKPQLVVVDDSDVSLAQSDVGVSQTTMSVSETTITMKETNNATNVSSSQINFDIPENHGLLTDLEEDRDSSISFLSAPTPLPTMSKTHAENKKSKQQAKTKPNQVNVRFSDHSEDTCSDNSDSIPSPPKRLKKQTKTSKQGKKSKQQAKTKPNQVNVRFSDHSEDTCSDNSDSITSPSQQGKKSKKPAKASQNKQMNPHNNNAPLSVLDEDSDSSVSFPSAPTPLRKQAKKQSKRKMSKKQTKSSSKKQANTQNDNNTIPTNSRQTNDLHSGDTPKHEKQTNQIHETQSSDAHTEDMPTKKAVNSQPRASFLVPYVVSDESDSELDWTASWREPDSRDLSDHEQVIPEPEMQSERQSADSSNPISSDDNDQETDDESQINDEDNPAKGYLQSGNYMPFQKSLELLLRSESSYDHIPSGKKENVYFVLNNETNLANRDSNRKSDFSDDCGVWNSLVGTTPTTYYKIDAHGNFKTIYKNSKLGFCNLSRVKGKNGRTERKYVPLNPQPAENEIMVLHRYYATSNADPNYKKRVTWLGKGGVQTNLAIVEYRGKFPGLKPHGNSKDSESEYLRTPAHVMTEVAELLKSNKPKMVFEHMKKKYDEVTRPTSIQQIRDKKKYDKAKNQDTLTGYSKNAADHIQQLENMVTHNHSYVRAIVRTNAKTPVVILYNDEQLSDIKNICCSGQAVLGVDKTFNLCDVHVTVTCYKQTSVVRHNSDDENAFPIFLGPIFFHDNSDFETYCAFFHHLKMKLIDANLTKLVIGTDDEAAMVKAITTAFPESTHVLCTRHLRQNTNQKLLDDAVDKAERNQILNKIYGQDGILHADDTICFEEKCSELEEQCAQISTKFHRQVR